MCEAGSDEGAVAQISKKKKKCEKNGADSATNGKKRERRRKKNGNNGRSVVEALFATNCESLSGAASMKMKHTNAVWGDSQPRSSRRCAEESGGEERRNVFAKKGSRK